MPYVLFHIFHKAYIFLSLVGRLYFEHTSVSMLKALGSVCQKGVKVTAESVMALQPKRGGNVPGEVHSWLERAHMRIDRKAQEADYNTHDD